MSRAKAKVEASVDGVAALQRLLEYTFESTALLQLALTHRSFTYEARGGAYEIRGGVEVPAGPKSSQKNAPGTDNEQLEFLGDAILGVVVSEALFREFPHSSEGELTRMRSVLVSRKRMADFGALLQLGTPLLLGRSAEQNGGRSKPALLANAAEAVIAAVYLDAGAKGLETVRGIVDKYLIAPEIEGLRAVAGGQGALRDAKTLLQERVQATVAGKLRYVDVSQSGPAHQRTFMVEAQLTQADETRVLATAEGPSKKEAQQRAAELALAAWELQP